MKTTSNSEFQKILDEAHAAGMARVDEAKKSLPMYNAVDGFTGRIVGSPFPICGFAWVNLKPATSTFARWLMKNHKSHDMSGWRKDSYYGGLTLWISDFQQSHDLKFAYASGYAQVLNAHGFKAYAMSRLD